MSEQSHLNALRLRLSHEQVRLTNAKSAKEREFRAVQISQCQKEIDSELKFLGIVENEIEMSDEELLAALKE